MYYASGNYEAFARPKKPEGVDQKSAYIVGSGLAALTAACYLVRDGQMKGEHVHILEKEQLAGGACDGWKFENVRLCDAAAVKWTAALKSGTCSVPTPSIETEGVSVLDEYYWLNKEDPNYSLCRATVNRGEDAHTDGKFDISDKGAMEIMKLFFTPNEDLQNKRITDVFDDEVLNSNFWLYWRTMFAFENWHSALEMKLYIQRFIHHIGGLPDFKALRFTKYNQYESMILPMVKYLESYGVQFHFGVKVTNVEFDCNEQRKLATRIDTLRDGKEEHIDLTENDLVFITNGGCVENSSIGDQNTPAKFNTEIRESGGWDMWRKIAAQDAFGPPGQILSDPEQTNWMSATVGALDDASFRISRTSASAARSRQCAARIETSKGLLPVAFKLDHQPPAAVQRNYSRGPRPIGSMACSPTSPAITSKSRCASAPARRSAWNGCITSVYRRIRLKSLRRRAPTPCRA